MLARMLAAILLLFAATSVATAQRPLPLPSRPPFPAEKWSTKPVQANPMSEPTGPEKAQKQRWDERSKIPSAPLR